MNTGCFYGVGIGPGDPELLTLKAVRIMESCEVIATPQTTNGDMLALEIASGAIDLSGKTILPMHFPMSRDPAVLDKAHREVADAIEPYLKSGRDVAMLNIGDVSIYSTYAYVMEILQERGYRTQMIPGVPSFCAVAARLGVSLTEMHTPLHIVPGNMAEREALDLHGTKVLMKSGKQMQKVLDALRARGLLEKSMLVENCGMAEESVYPDLSQNAPEGNPGYFATVIVKE